MPRTKGSKNKNTNTAKNKNIININVNTSTKKKRGRPSKTNDTTNNNKNTRNQQLVGGGLYNTRAPVFTAPPPPVSYISPPQPDQTNSLLSSFITSRLLNESTMTNRPSMTNMTTDEPSRRETLNLRESIIPKVEDTPLKSTIKPPPFPPPPQSGPPPPPPPPPHIIKSSDVKPPTNTEFKAGNLTGQDAINAELKYRASEAGKAEMARKKAEKEAKKADNKAEKEGKSMLDSIGISFPSPVTAAKTTPSKSTAVIVRPQQQSMFDFVLGGGTPSKQHTKPTEEDVKKGAKIKRVKELNSKPDKTTKETLQYNDLRQELAGTPNENPVIASNAIKNAFKGKLARNEMKTKASMKQSELNDKREAALSIQKAIRGHNVRKQIVDEAKVLEKQIKGVEKQVKKAKKEHTLNVLDDLAYKTRVQKGKNKAMDVLTKDILNVSESITTRGQTEPKARKLVKLSSAKDKLAKSSFKKVGPGRPRKSNAMTELEKQVSGQLLSI